MKSEMAPKGPSSGTATAGRWPIYIAIGLSGASALGAEVVWTRLMGMLLLATVCMFSPSSSRFSW